MNVPLPSTAGWLTLARCHTEPVLSIRPTLHPLSPIIPSPSHLTISFTILKVHPREKKVHV